MYLMHLLKISAKNIIASFLFYSGILFVIKAIKLRNKVVVLMYHRVLDDHERSVTFSHPGIIVRNTTFAKQMKCLKKYFRVYSQNDFLQHLEGDSIFRSSGCLITFDDGWSDNYVHAYPVLKTLHMHAVIFLATGCVGTHAGFWQERLAAELFKRYCMTREEDFRVLGKYNLEAITSQSPSQAQNTIREFITGLKELESPELQIVLDELLVEDTQDALAEKRIDVFLDWKQINEMSQNNISFGSHSVHHHILTKIPLKTAFSEIHDSRSCIEKHTNKTPELFCYPNGNYSSEISAIVIDSGYKAAFSTKEGHFGRPCNNFALPRINIHEDATNTIPLFMAKILGLF